MRENFIQTKGEQFFLNEKPILLRGWALGSWMNFEHFMMGLPGTNSMILDAFSEVYGEERRGMAGCYAGAYSIGRGYCIHEKHWRKFCPYPVRLSLFYG